MSDAADIASAAAPNGAGAPGGPTLGFEVVGCSVLAQAAVPTLAFDLRIEGPAGMAIRSVILDVQLQIAARRRGYAPAEEERLVELFGSPERWGSTLRTVPWTRTTVVVPPFRGSGAVELTVPCSYDLEVAASKYFDGLESGEVPLEFLFTGSVFYGEAGRLQTTRIAWESEAQFRLPVATWKAAIERHFPGAAWLRLDRETFDRLQAFKAQQALPSFEAALDELLDTQGE